MSANEVAIGLQILVYEPEGAVVRRVDSRGAVISPSAMTCLVMRAGKQSVLRFHGTGCIGRNAPRIGEARIDAAARDAVAQQHIARFIHGHTAHPSESGVGSVSSLLEDGRRIVGSPNFIQRGATLEPPVTEWLTTNAS